MTFLLQLFDFNSIGWALVHFLWQGVMIGLIASIVLGMIDRRSSQARYLVSCVAMFACLLAFLGTVVSLSGVESAAIQQGPTQLQIVGEDPARLGLDELIIADFEHAPEAFGLSLVAKDADPASSSMKITINSIISIMAILWCIGIFGMGIRFARSWGMTQVLRKQGEDDGLSLLPLFAPRQKFNDQKYT